MLSTPSRGAIQRSHLPSGDEPARRLRRIAEQLRRARSAARRSGRARGWRRRSGRRRRRAAASCVFMRYLPWWNPSRRAILVCYFTNTQVDFAALFRANRVRPPAAPRSDLGGAGGAAPPPAQPDPPAAPPRRPDQQAQEEQPGQGAEQECDELRRCSPDHSSRVGQRLAKRRPGAAASPAPPPDN